MPLRPGRGPLRAAADPDLMIDCAQPVVLAAG